MIYAGTFLAPYGKDEVRLKVSRINSIKPKVTRFIEWEEGKTGLGVRVFPSGAKSFVYMYRFEGKPRMMTLGKYPTVTLADARKKVAGAKEQLEEGVDPGIKFLKEKEIEKNAHTVRHLVDEFLVKWSKPRKKTWREDQRCLEREVLPRIGKKKVKEVRRRDIILNLDRIEDRGSPGMANRTLNVISKLFQFAISRDIIDSSPCVSISFPAKKNERDRVLEEQEIRIFWEKLDDAPITEINKLALKLMLVTGQRGGGHFRRMAGIQLF